MEVIKSQAGSEEKSVGVVENEATRKWKMRGEKSWLDVSFLDTHQPVFRPAKSAFATVVPEARVSGI